MARESFSRGCDCFQSCRARRFRFVTLLLALQGGTGFRQVIVCKDEVRIPTIRYDYRTCS